MDMCEEGIERLFDMPLDCYIISYPAIVRAAAPLVHSKCSKTLDNRNSLIGRIVNFAIYCSISEISK